MATEHRYHTERDFELDWISGNNCRQVRVTVFVCFDDRPLSLTFCAQNPDLVLEVVVDQEGSWREGPLGSAPNEGQTCMFCAVVSSVCVSWRGSGGSCSCLGQELTGSEPSRAQCPCHCPFAFHYAVFIHSTFSRGLGTAWYFCFLICKFAY